MELSVVLVVLSHVKTALIYDWHDKRSKFDHFRFGHPRIDKATGNRFVPIAPCTESPTVSPVEYGEWSNWSACSAQCGVGKRIRYRPCSPVCSKPYSESEGCLGPDGECQRGCRIDIGDFQLSEDDENWLDSKCAQALFRGSDGFYVPPNIKCLLTCDGPKTGTVYTSDWSLKWGTWSCKCIGVPRFRALNNRISPVRVMFFC